MKRNFFRITISLFLVLLLVSCSAKSSYDPNQDYNNETGIMDSAGNILISERKIIYTVDISLKAKKLEETTASIKALLEDEEWVEKETSTSSTNYLILRVKSSRLNAFIDNLRGNYETTNYTLTSKDVSLDYLDSSASKEALENELARLLQLYETANVNEMININRRIYEVEQELIKINRILNTYDSLVDYSTVSIWIYGPTGNPNPPTYGNKLSTTLQAGWNAVKSLLTVASQVIVFLVPFLIIIVPVTGAAIGLNYYLKQKKKKKENK